MKTMKKMISLIVVLMLSMSLAVPSFAADGTTYSLTIKGTTGHTYEVYQIFTGDLATEGGDKILSNIKWGSGVTEAGQTELGNAATKAESLKTTADAEAFADEVAAYLTKDTKKIIEVEDGTPPDGVYKVAELAPGYYLVKDKKGEVPDQDQYTQFILKVVGNAEVNAKSSETTSEKKVMDTNDSTGTTTGWQDSADYDIGDVVPFQLKATITDKYDKYESYELIFHDKESAGLEFDATSVKVYVDGTEIKTGYTVVTEGLDDECTFEVRFENLKKDIETVKAGSVITVEYTSTLTTSAVVGPNGNTNTMYLEYSNNPNSDQDGETGKTPDNTVIVFTYKVVINKVDENQNALTGAEFKLEKKIGETWTVIDRLTVEQGTKFTFTGLDDGKYRLTETKTPAGYNTIEPIEFEITATHNGLVLDGLSGTVIEFTSNVAEGSLTSDIVNQKGVTLPETGGMGTTLFYIVGGVLIVGAFVAFVTKKRMER